jgi:hypothetical protein
MQLVVFDSIRNRNNPAVLTGASTQKKEQDYRHDNGGDYGDPSCSFHTEFPLSSGA